MPERHIHLDAVGGVAGDMVVAALVDALPDLRARVLADIAAALPAAAGLPDFREGSSGGIRALFFGLRHGGTASQHEDGDDDGDGHDHDDNDDNDDHDDDDHDHDHGHLPSPQPAGDRNKHAAGAGSFRDMVDRIRAADKLEPGTADHAVAILTSLAEVEAAIHRVAVDAVQFHEIADWDSLMDVVAAGSLAAALEPATWSVSELPRGAGLVRTRHGFLPVPTPATASLLVGFRWRDDGVGGERVTPTGAAVLRHLVGPESAGRRPAAGRLAAIGTGAGTRNLPGMPNVLRVLVFEAEGSASQDAVAVLSFDIDDMTGEEIGVAAQRLRGLPGVLDLSVGMRLGKKGRFTSDVRLLVTPEARETVAAACLSETSTIGLRWRVEQRVVLPRTAVSGAAGVRTKQVTRPGGEVTVKAESDDVAGESLAARRAARALAEAAAAPVSSEPRHGR
ncbi:MAG: LarC family nickel insertion protein [Xanthobacteraceae bacterium]